MVAVSSYLSSPSGEETLVHPHQLRISAGGPHVVSRIEFLGATSRYTVVMNDGSTVVADVEPSTPLQVGNSCSVHLHEKG
jgi:hypothetical protein